MKTLYLIGGTMGVGKTSACRALQQLLPNSVFLDGDWCWNIWQYNTSAVVTVPLLRGGAFCRGLFAGSLGSFGFGSP